MEAIKNEQYNFLQSRTQKLINAYSTVNDQSVLHALKQLIEEEVKELVSEMSLETQQLFLTISSVQDKITADRYLSKVKPYVRPFIDVSEDQLKRLFPKVKKFKGPALNQIPLQEISYLSWEDQGTNKRYIVAPYENRIIGLQGSFSTNHQKNICSICNRFESVGLFSVESKGKVQGTYTVRGNYICSDYLTCNRNLTSLQKLHDFLLPLLS
jgi:hypothetical protein